MGSEADKWRQGSKFADIAAYISPGRVTDAATELKKLLLEEIQP